MAARSTAWASKSIVSCALSAQLVRSLDISLLSLPRVSLPHDAMWTCHAQFAVSVADDATVAK